MNSKGIQPRVGMQVRYRGESFKIATIYCNCLYNSTGMHEMCGNSWRFGEATIEWIPPTDEERVMFANAAHNWRTWNPTPNSLMELDRWANMELTLTLCSDVASCFESLALDGMDIDDVSKIEELMR